MRTIIPKAQIAQRWDTLPEEIKDAMTSDKNAEAMDRIYAQLHIPEDKQKYVALTASYAFMGFVHLEDMAKEIESSLAMNSLHARELADSITQAIFAPYRDMLEKIYTGKVEELARPRLDSIIAPASASQSGPKPLASFAPAPAAAPLAPPTAKSLSVPISPLSFSSPPSSLPSLGAMPAKPITAPSPTPTAPPSTTNPSPPVAPAPAPFMMHAETKVQPIIQAPKFTMESLGGTVSSFSGRTGTSMAPPKIARVEIGKEEVEKPTGVVSRYAEAVTPRTIHYSSLYTPLPSNLGTSPSGPVSMGTIQGGPSVPAAPAPKPAAPPSAAPPPAGGPPGSGGFIKTLITPKNEKLGLVPPPPPQK